MRSILPASTIMMLVFSLLGCGGDSGMQPGEDNPLANTQWQQDEGNFIDYVDISSDRIESIEFVKSDGCYHFQGSVPYRVEGDKVILPEGILENPAITEMTFSIESNTLILSMSGMSQSFVKSTFDSATFQPQCP